MNILPTIKTFLFLLSNCLLYPAVIFLCGGAVWAVYEAGRTLGICVSRRRKEGDSNAVAAFRKDLEALLAGRHCDADVARLLQLHRQRIDRSLDKFRLALRFGPACGLIGTLVPMGTALASLGEGDLTIMTSELVMAYTTTVVGLALGCVSALLLCVRRRHAESDVLEMEYLAEKSTSGQEDLR
ncbi:MAG: MotA/TolQ/ExbB proton channel family protein [Victivallales bacterium]|nr:MotA/TolQ/ExbB proton channel family protein [Victivallales bacterium]